MHLFIFLTLRNPGIFMRLSITVTQFVVMNAFMFAYLISPRFCHRLVGYIEEEAVHTYTVCLKCIDDNMLPSWKVMRAPPEAIDYYGLDPKTATMRDVILSVRADEAVHRSVNHHFGDIPEFYDIENDKLHISSQGFRDLPEDDKKMKMLEDGMDA